MHWDFAVILLFLATVVPVLGRRRIRKLLATPQTTKSDRLVLYASTAGSQWVAAALIFWRTSSNSITLRSLGIAIPNAVLTAIISVLLAALIFINQIVSLRRLAARPSEIKGILPQLALKVFPQDGPERVAFLGVVITVAICEEFIYRGFAQRVFEDWSGGYAVAAILGSAAMFGLAHVYQGRRGLISTFVVGTLFSAVRGWTGSLLAPVLAHFVADLTAGMLAPSRVRAALETAGGASTGGEK